MKDLTMHVQSTGGLLLFPNTCRISGNDPNPGGGVCLGASTPPHRPGHDPKTDPTPREGTRPGSDHDRGPRRASDLEALRQALRSALKV